MHLQFNYYMLFEAFMICFKNFERGFYLATENGNLHLQTFTTASEQTQIGKISYSTIWNLL